MVDATYKLNEFKMPLYLKMVIDGNGQSEIVAMFLTSVETKQAIADMIHAFKEQHGKGLGSSSPTKTSLNILYQ